jgi:hypothetical protein
MNKLLKCGDNVTNELTMLASFGTVVGTDRFRVRDAMMTRFLKVRLPSCSADVSDGKLVVPPRVRLTVLATEDAMEEAMCDMDV